jgi:hypothetical protein
MRLIPFLAAAIVIGSTLLAAGCVVHAPRPRVVVSGPVVEYGYEPVLYDGYVVYYLDDGLPFIWVNGARIWIPDAHRPYYLAHYRAHHRAYRAWVHHRGEHYRGQRYQDRHRGPPSHDRPALRRADERPAPRERPALRRTDERERGAKPGLRPARERPPAPKPALRKADDRKKPTLRKADDKKADDDQRARLKKS